MLTFTWSFFFLKLTVICLVLQDLYVDRLTENVDKLREQISLYEAQFYAQGEETKAAKEALSEARLEIEVCSIKDLGSLFWRHINNKNC